MEINLNSKWKSLLNWEINQPYFIELMNSVEDEYSKNTCFPPKELIFSAFDYCSFENLKVVIIGQDPYHGEGEANGLCFSVNDSVKIPPSLKNIFREINLDFDALLVRQTEEYNKVIDARKIRAEQAALETPTDTFTV